MTETPPAAPRPGYAEKYLRNQSRGVRSRWRTGLERRALRRSLALAGHPRSVLDLPCGTGRFWPTLAAACAGELIAADIDPDMLDVAQRVWPAGLTRRFRTFTSSALDIDAPDDLVDTVVSMRFLHHLARAEDRRRALTEMARVARRSVIVSLWTDRSLSAWWHRAKTSRNLQRGTPGYGPRVCVPARLFESEAQQCGLDVIGHVDVLPGIAKWRLYVLRVRRPATAAAALETAGE